MKPTDEKGPDLVLYFVVTEQRSYNAIDGKIHLRNVRHNWGDESKTLAVFRWDMGWHPIDEYGMDE